MPFFRPRRLLCAVIAAVLLLGLSACAGAGGPAAPSSGEPEETAAPTVRVWEGSFDARPLVQRRLGLDLDPWLKSHLPAVLRLEITPEGRCLLRGDYAPCAELLQPALAALLKELEREESGKALGGASLSRSLGASPEDFAAALCDELLPPSFTLRGRYDEAGGEILWDGGQRSAVKPEGDYLRVSLPDLGEIMFSPIHEQA